MLLWIPAEACRARVQHFRFRAVFAEILWWTDFGWHSFHFLGRTG